MASGSDYTPLIAIVGETASGKSALALDLAQQFNGEIIAADSWTVYKGFDIGTAKPSAQDQATVRHHLLDIANPKDGFSAVLFKRRALEAIQSIESRHKIPFLVGGTGLYIDSVLFDYGFLPGADPVQRAKYSAMTLEELRQLIVRKGLDTTGIDMRNKRRLVRLIETEGRRPARSGVRPNSLIIGVATDRGHLEQRIEQRVEVMLRQGLEQEVAALAKRYGWEAEPMKGIGYREFRDYYEGSQTLDQTRQRIVRATLGLAKRQRTWFKRNKSIQWVKNREDTVELITTFLNK